MKGLLFQGKEPLRVAKLSEGVLWEVNVKRGAQIAMPSLPCAMNSLERPMPWNTVSMVGIKVTSRKMSIWIAVQLTSSNRMSMNGYKHNPLTSELS